MKIIELDWPKKSEAKAKEAARLYLRRYPREWAERFGPLFRAQIAFLLGGKVPETGRICSVKGYMLWGAAFHDGRTVARVLDVSVPSGDADSFYHFFRRFELNEHGEGPTSYLYNWSAPSQHQDALGGVAKGMGYVYDLVEEAWVLS